MKSKQIVTAVAFFAALAITATVFLLTPDGYISSSERRYLTQFAAFDDWHKAHPGGSTADYFAYLEKYALDQFPARDYLRKLKALFGKYMLLQKDFNGYYTVDGHLAKMDAELSEKAVEDAIKRINAVYSELLRPVGANAYYALVPDKNYFIAQDNGYLHIDYEKLFYMVRDRLDGEITEIDLKSELTIDDYYTTDPHWEQSKLPPIADVLLSAFGASGTSSATQWQAHKPGLFCGTYYGHAALPAHPEELVYLTNGIIENCTVYDNVANEYMPVYNENNFGNVDPYDVFLGGAKPLLTIDNPSQTNGKQLVVFRDSFGSSMVPLLVGEYSQTIVIDLRYISQRQLASAVSFSENCDVLFLYSTSIIKSFGAFAN